MLGWWEWAAPLSIGSATGGNGGLWLFRGSNREPLVGHDPRAASFSWDAAYRTGLRMVVSKGKPVLRPDGTPKLIHRPALTPEAKQWKRDVQLLAQAARPSIWHPRGQIRVLVELHLVNDMDDDNAMKLARDALHEAIGYDDIHFLMCTVSKEAGVPLRDACIKLTIDDDTTHD